MDFLGLALLLLLLDISVLFGVILCKKGIGKRICAFVYLFIALFGSALLLKTGVFDFVGKLVSPMIATGEIAFLGMLTESAINYIVRLVLFQGLFLVIFFFLHLIGFIIIKCSKLDEKTGFKKHEDEEKGKMAVSGILTGVTCWFFCFCLFLPYTSFISLTSPALHKASKEAYADTYAHEVVVAVQDDCSFLTDKSPVYLAGKYTGANFLTGSATGLVTKVSATNSDGVTVRYDANDFISSILVTGVDAIALYEKSISAELTYDDLSGTPLLRDLASSPIVTATACEWLKTSGYLKPETAESNGTWTHLLSTYTSENGADALSKDIKVIDDILNAFFTKNAGKEFNPDGITTELLDFVTDSYYADVVADGLTKLTVFNDAAVTVTGYGVDILCEKLGIEKNKDDAYRSFCTSLLERLNDRSIGEINFAQLEEYIDYYSGISVGAGSISQTPENNENYERYIAWYTSVNDLFVSYGIDEFAYAEHLYFAGTNNFYYNPVVNDVYGWDKRNYSDGYEWKHSFLLTQYLIQEANAVIHTDELTKDALIQLLNSFTAEYIQGNYPNITATQAAYFSSLALKIASPEQFTTTRIFEEDIEKLIVVPENADREIDKQALAKIFKTGGAVFATVRNTDDTVDALLSHFGDMGKILDALSAYSVTAEVAPTLLKAIAQQEAFAKYFQYESIVKITENVKNGTSTYEELFISIQSLYNIANEII